MDIFPKIEGSVADWDVIVHGHLRWNRFFGESAENPPRGDPSTCGSALITGKLADGSVYRLLVDPTLHGDAQGLDFSVNRRTGLHLSDVTHCFSTHHHADHVDGLLYLPGAKWLAPQGVIDAIADEGFRAKLCPAFGEFLPGVVAVPLPGHTAALHGVAFSFGGKRMLVAGDAIMSRHHFAACRTEFQDDPMLIARAEQSIRDIKESFDVVLPGHDNLILL